MIGALTISHTMALVGIGIFTWVGLAVLVTIAVVRTIRQRDRRAQEAAEQAKAEGVFSGEVLVDDVDELTRRTTAGTVRSLRSSGLDIYL